MHLALQVNVNPQDTIFHLFKPGIPDFLERPFLRDPVGIGSDAKKINGQPVRVHLHGTSVRQLFWHGDGDVVKPFISVCLPVATEVIGFWLEGGIKTQA